MTIGLFIDTITGTSGYQESIWLGVTDAARELGVKTITFTGGMLEYSPYNPFEKSRNIAYELLDLDKIDGLVLCGGTIGNNIPAERFAEFCRRFMSVPVISVGPVGSGIPRILVDNNRGMKDMVNHLVKEHGYSNIAFISGPSGNVDADRRKDIFLKTMAENGLAVDSALIFEGDFNDPSGVAAVKHWFDKLGLRPQAIVASNDNMAFGALEALAERGIPVPYEVAVTGFDDLASAATSTPPLSTVRQPIYKQARRAMQELIGRIKGGTLGAETLEPPEQVYRQSCGCLSTTLAAFADAPAETVESAIATIGDIPGFAGNGDLANKVAAFISLAAKPESPDSEIYAPFNTMIQKDIVSGQNVEKWYGLVNLVRSVAPARTTLHHRLHAMVGDSVIQQIYLMRSREERYQALLSATERELITSFNLDNLRQTMRETFPRLGIDGAVLCIFDDFNKPLEGSHVAAAFRNGKEVPYPASSFPSRTLVPASVAFTASTSSSLIVLPLYYREDKLGYIVYEQNTGKGKVYEALSAELSSALEGAILIERVMKAEADLKAHSLEIERLIRPMIDSIKTVANSASGQREIVGRLENLNKQSIQSIALMQSMIVSLTESLDKTGLLASEINNISEVINVVAINASIEAAHFGREGAAFAVIAGEVRKLAEATRRNSDSIIGFLSSVEEKITGVTNLNKDVSSAFNELSATIRTTVQTLETIMAHMSNLGQGSNDILRLMNG